jgi:hypothetical protein
MVATHSFELRFPLPAHLPPSFVIGHIQKYEPLMTPHPYLVRFERRPLAVADVADDPFFREDGHKLQRYHVTDLIRFMPGIAKEITVPAVFQSFETGARVRADAQAGVRVWSTFSVEKSETAGGEEAWDFVERAELKCPGLLKSFVVHKLETAHKENCGRMVEDFVSSYEKAQREGEPGEQYF